MAEKKFKGIAADFIQAIKTQFIGKGADPNDIFVQDLYNYQPPVTQGSAISRLLKGKENVLKLNPEQRQFLDSILKVFTEHIETKRELLTQSRQLFENPIISTIIDVILDDGFNSFYNEKEEFRIEYHLDEDEKNLLGSDFQDNIQNIIDEFVDKFSIKARVAEIVPELIRDGEYAFGVLFDEQNKKGITEVVDDMDVINLLPFYEGDKLCFVVKQDSFENDKFNTNLSKPCFYKPDNIIFFRLKGQNKKKINLSAFYDTEFRSKFYEETHIRLPKYIRVSTPLYYSAMKYLNRLQIMENVSTVLDLADVLKPEIVTVTIPSTTNEVEAKNIIRDYERHLNNQTGLTDQENLDLSTLAATANYRKVLPQWMDTKGTISSTEVGHSDSNKTASAWDSINHIRNLIALSVGVPPYYFNITEQPQDKGQTIKLYSRYTNKLTSLQKSLSEGVKDFIMLHLTKMGINISRDNLEVTFKTLNNGDSLDDLDIMTGTIEGVNNYYKGLKEIADDENNNFEIDEEQFKKYYDSVTSRFLNTKDILIINKNKQQGFEPGGGEEFESGEEEFEVTGEGPSKDFDAGFEEAGVSGSDEPITSGSETPYENFARQDDGISLEGPQEIETEV